jgi:predicted transcriptional regulator
MSTASSENNGVTIREIMTTDIITTTPDTAVEAIADELRNRGIGGLPVVDENGYLIGMISEYDVISKRGRTVGEIMSRGVISVGDEASAEQVTTSDLLRLYSLVRWTCQTCGDFERGLFRPDKCARCGSSDFTLETERRTGEGF